MAKERFTTPRMRFVQGDVDEPQTKDAQGNLRVVKTGPNAGQPNPQYFVAGAITKNSPEWPAFWEKLVRQAAADFPNLIPAAGIPALIAAGPAKPYPTGSVLHPNFSFKVADGDGLDDNGKPNADKPGFAGHWVVRFASSYPPKAFHVGHYAPQEQIQEKGAIKRGYFIRVNGTASGNGNAQRPGLYMNLDLVELTETCPPDQLIITGPSAADAFGSAAPVTAAAPPPAPVAAAAAPPPAPVAAASGLPAALADGWIAHPQSPGYFYKGQDVKSESDVAALYPAAAPYAGFIPGQSAPTAAPPSPPATAPISAPPATISPTSGPTMTAAANGATYDQMIAAGWTDETLRANGMMA